MSNLSLVDKQFLESVFEMDSGYVLNFSNKSFSKFFNDIGINIDNPYYTENGNSKAKRLKAHWEKDSEESVGKSIIARSKIMENNLLLGRIGFGHTDAKEQYLGQIKKVREIGKELLAVANTGENVMGIIQQQNEDLQKLIKYIQSNSEHYGIPVSELFFDFSDISKVIAYTDGVMGKDFIDEHFDAIEDDTRLKAAIRTGIGKEILKKIPENSEWTIKLINKREAKMVVNNSIQNNTVNNSGNARNISLSKNMNASPENKRVSIFVKLKSWLGF